MNLEELRAAIRAGRYADTDNIYTEADETYSVTPAVRADGIWVDTVGGFRARWGW